MIASIDIDGAPFPIYEYHTNLWNKLTPKQKQIYTTCGGDAEQIWRAVQQLVEGGTLPPAAPKKEPKIINPVALKTKRLASAQ